MPSILPEYTSHAKNACPVHTQMILALWLLFPVVLREGDDER